MIYSEARTFDRKPAAAMRIAKREGTARPGALEATAQADPPLDEVRTDEGPGFDSIGYLPLAVGGWEACGVRGFGWGLYFFGVSAAEGKLLIFKERGFWVLVRVAAADRAEKEGSETTIFDPNRPVVALVTGHSSRGSGRHILSANRQL